MAGITLVGYDMIITKILLHRNDSCLGGFEAKRRPINPQVAGLNLS